jgi:Fis family transcriptional regulator
MAGKKPLRDHVRKTVRRYLKDMGSTEPENLYRSVLSQVEPPLITEALRYTDGNQTRAARILGMTRNTLRSKMRQYGISCP